MISVRQLLSVFLLLTVTSALADSGYIYQSGTLPTALYDSPSVGPSLSPTPTPQVIVSSAQPRIVNSHDKPDTNIRFFTSLNLSPIDHNYLQESEATYVVNGRILKQYLVEEQLDDVLPPNNFGVNPLLFTDFDNLYSKYSQLNQDFFRIRVSQGPSSLIRPVTNNHGPVALGSGGLGYIRQPNGGVFIGSGSLGYISNQQRVNDVNDARRPKGNTPTPTNFGDGDPAPLF